MAELINSTSNTLVVGTADDDSILNVGSGVTVDVGAGNDTVNNGGGTVLYSVSASGGSLSVIDAGDGDDFITNIMEAVTIDGGTGNDRINNSLTVTVDAESNLITITGARSVLNGGDDSDTIENALSDNVTLNGGAGDDTLINIGVGAVIDAGADADYVNNSGANTSIDGGLGDDTIINNADDATITSGDGEDSIVIGSGVSIVRFTDLDIASDKLSFARSLEAGSFSQTIDDNGLDLYSAEMSIFFSNVDSLTTDFLNYTVDNAGTVNSIRELLGMSDDTTVEPSTVDVVNANVYLNDHVSLIGVFVVDGTEITDSDTFYEATFTTLAGANDVVVGSVTADHVYSARNGLGRQFIDLDNDNWSITAANAADTIFNYGSTGGDNVTINAGDGIVSVDSHGKFCLLLGGDDNDTIHNYVSSDDADDGSRSTILSGAGDDNIDNHGRYAYVDGGFGNDTITNYNNAFFEEEGEYSTILGGDGDDSINNTGMHAYIDGGEGNDTISSSGSNVTIDGGADNDVIDLNPHSGSAIITYADGDGDDTIDGFTFDTATLRFADGLSTTSVQSGANIIITATGSSVGSITLVDVLDSDTVITPTVPPSTVEAVNANVTLSNSTASIGAFVVDGSAITDSDTFYDAAFSMAAGASDVVVGSVTADHVYSARSDSGRQNISINSDNWNVTATNTVDSISNGYYDSGSNVTINAGAGDDSIDNLLDGSLSAINGDAGNDYIFNSASSVTINGGTGNDDILNYGDMTTINAGDGDDTINNQLSGSLTAINGGTGNDSIVNFGLDIGSDVTIDGGAGNDFIDNFGSKVTIYGFSGNDVISNSGSSVTIDAGDGNDSIRNFGSNVTIAGGAGNDSIYNSSLGANEYIDGGAGNNYISNLGSDVTINTGDGYDTIISDGSNTTINGGTSDDFIRNSGSNVTINAGDDDDYIINDYSYFVDENGNTIDVHIGEYIFVNGGDGNDTIFNAGENVTINGGKGDDVISLNGGSALITYADGDGDDTIIGYSSDTATLQFADGISTTSVQSGANMVITATGNSVGSIILVDVLEPITVEIVNVTVTLSNSTASIGAFVVDGSAITDSDTFYNAAFTTLSGASDVVVGSVTADHVYSARSTGGRQFISVWDNNWTVTAANSDDSIYNEGNGAIINAGAGNDTIENYRGANATLDAGAGNDFIYSDGSDVTIDGGAGSDVITLNGGSALITYADGNGDDTIYGYSSDTATLRFADGLSTASVQSGDNLIINVEGSSGGSITLVDYTPNIVNAVNANVTLSTSTASIGVFVVDSTSITDSDTFYDAAFTTLAGANDVVVGTVSSDQVYSARSGANRQSITVESDWNVTATDNDDVINVNGDSVTVNAGVGNDLISNVEGEYASLNGGAGDDSINSYSAHSTVLGGAGNDFIINGAWLNDDKVTEHSSSLSAVDGGSGNDTILNVTNDVTIRGGAGNDVISLGNDVDTVYNNSDEPLTIGTTSDSVLITYADGDGDDTVYGFSPDTATLRFADGISTASVQSGDNLIITATGSSVGSITLVDYTPITVEPVTLTNPAAFVDLSTADSTGAYVVDGYATIASGVDFYDAAFKTKTSTLATDILVGNVKRDHVYSAQSKAARQIIFINDDWRVTATKYNDEIKIGGSRSSVKAGKGDDTITVVGTNSTVNAGSGKDQIFVYDNDNVIKGGGGKDTVIVGEAVTNIVLADLAKSDLLSLTSAVAEHSFDAVLDDDNISLTSDRMNIIFQNKSLSTILNYTVDNAGTLNTIEELLISVPPEPTPTVPSIEFDTANAKVNLSDSTSSSGVFVVDGLSVTDSDTFYDATFTTLAGSTDIAVGSVTADHVYSARLDTSRQQITIGSDGWSVTATDNNDTIELNDSNSTVNAGAGDNNINLYVGSGMTVEDVLINADDGNDYMRIYTDGNSDANSAVKNTTLNAGSGNNTIVTDWRDAFVSYWDYGHYNYWSENLSINVGDGDDHISLNHTNINLNVEGGNNFILSQGVLVTINAGAGDDFITNYGDHVIINFGGGRDTIINNNLDVTINGSASDDRLFMSYESIHVSGTDISLGGGDDTITLAGTVNYNYSDGDGNDTIYGFDSDTAALQFASGLSTASVASGTDMIINVTGSNVGSITLVDVIDTDTVITPTVEPTPTVPPEPVVTITAANANIRLSDSTSSIGAFIVDGLSATNSSAFYDAKFTTVVGTSDVVVGSVTADHVYSARRNAARQNITVESDWNLAATNNGDSIHVIGDNVSVNAGGGNDTVHNEGWYATLSAGGGSDVISINGGSATIQYADGDGKDTVYGFSSDIATLQFASGLSTTSVRSGTDAIITVNGSSKGTITLVDVFEPITITAANANINLSDSISSRGALVVDGTLIDDTNAFYNAAFKTSTVENDVVVGTVSSAHHYSALGDAASQNITVGADWNVIATDFDDVIKVSGSTSTITSGDGDDVISLGSGVSSITLTDLSSDDVLSFRQAINEHSLLSTLDAAGNTVLYSNRIRLTFNAALDDILNYTVDNAGTSNTIEDLISIPADDSVEPIDNPNIVVRLANAGSATGNFAVDGATVTDSDTFYEAAFTTSPGSNDIVVGTVSSDHVYATNYEYLQSIVGSDANDTVLSDAPHSTIRGDGGDDVISLGSDSASNVIAYFDEDGDDTVYGFDSDATTLRFADGLSTDSVQSGDNLIINVEGASHGSITLIDVHTPNTVEPEPEPSEPEPSTPHISLAFRNYNYDSDAAIFDGTSLDDKILLIGDANVKPTLLSAVDGISIWADDNPSARRINASHFGGQVILAGNALENVITASRGGASLWGGNGGDDTLIGGNGSDEFFYLKGNGADVIDNAGDDDVIELLNIGFEDIDVDSFADAIGSRSTSVRFNDGGTLTVNGTSQVGFRIGGATFCVDRTDNQRKWIVK